MSSNDPYSDQNLAVLEEKLGIIFKNRDFLKTAITTRAAHNENTNRVQDNNERLEFLGDSVLKFLISENLFQGKADPEGKMTIMRTEIENNHTLASIARELNIKPHLFLSKGEQLANSKNSRSYLANSLEAIIGAIYLDQNIDKTRDFVEKKILQELLRILLTEDIRNPITPLQEICQKKHGHPPKYVYHQINDNSQTPHFKAEVYINDAKIAESDGSSKKEAKKKAAKKALFLISN